MHANYWITHFLESWDEDSEGFEEFGEDESVYRKSSDELDRELNLTGYRNWTDAEEKEFERWFVDFFDIADGGEFIISSFSLGEYEFWSVEERKAFQRLLRTEDANLRALLKSTLSEGLSEYYEDYSEFLENACRDVHYALIADGIDWQYLEESDIAKCLEGRPEIFSVEGVRERLVGLLETQKESAGYYKDSVHPMSCEFFAESPFSFEEDVCLWATFIAKDPNVAKYCPDLNGLSGFSRCYLISERPEFENMFDLSELGNPASDCWTRPGVSKDAMYSRCRYVAGWNKMVSRWAQLLEEQELDSEVVDCQGVQDGTVDLPKIVG